MDANEKKVTLVELQKSFSADAQKIIMDTASIPAASTIKDWADGLRNQRQQIHAKLKRIKEQEAQLKTRKEQYEKDKRQVESVRQDIKQAQAEKEALSKQIQTFQNQKNQGEGNLKALPSLAYETLAEAQSKRTQIEKEADEMEADIQQKQRKSDTDLQALTRLRSRLETLNDQYTQTQKERVSADSDLDAAIQKYGFSDRDECRRYFVDADVLEENRTRIETYKKTMRDVNSKLKYAAEQAKQLEYKDVEALTTTLQKREQDLEAARNRRDAGKETYHNNQRCVDAFTSQAEHMESMRKQRDRTSRLYALLRGTIPGKDRVSLENYVQITGFKGILEAANRRLDPMTEGQYQLYLHEEHDGIHQNIFALDILDHWTGKKRSVRTLSGGESFKASLSLALGLSDFVTSGSGGIQINTLFIDEGFGTLDQQSLTDAMQVLAQLGETGKLVGVISHREELKEQMDRQIVVTKNRYGGSHIQIKPDG